MYRCRRTQRRERSAGTRQYEPARLRPLVRLIIGGGRGPRKRLPDPLHEGGLRRRRYGRNRRGHRLSWGLTRRESCAEHMALGAQLRNDRRDCVDREAERVVLQHDHWVGRVIRDAFELAPWDSRYDVTDDLLRLLGLAEVGL